MSRQQVGIVTGPGMVVGAVRHYARLKGADEDLWGLAGLLHDLDWERHPDEHPHVGVARPPPCPSAPVSAPYRGHGRSGLQVPPGSWDGSCPVRFPRSGPPSRGTVPNPPRTSTGNALMTTATWITMIVILAFVWGGLAMAVRTAIRKESAKSAE